MTSLVTCDNCKAVLTEADHFCGECGAPRPLPGDAEEPSPGAPSTPGSATTPATQQPAEPETRWRVAAVVLVVLGIITCLAAVLAFLLAGFLEYESMTALENWLFSALCCLLPIGGAGAILLAVGAAIWYTRLRSH